MALIQRNPFVLILLTSLLFNLTASISLDQDQNIEATPLLNSDKSYKLQTSFEKGLKNDDSLVQEMWFSESDYQNKRALGACVLAFVTIILCCGVLQCILDLSKRCKLSLQKPRTIGISFNQPFDQ